jgi:hypothetical protein
LRHILQEVRAWRTLLNVVTRVAIAPDTTFHGSCELEKHDGRGRCPDPPVGRGAQPVNLGTTPVIEGVVVVVVGLVVVVVGLVVVVVVVVGLVVVVVGLVVVVVELVVVVAELVVVVSGVAHVGPVMVLESNVRVPADPTKTRPFKVAPVFRAVVSATSCTKIFPSNEVFVPRVAALPILHHRLQGSPPVTDERDDVISVVTVLKIQTPDDPVRVRFPVSKKLPAEQ